MKESNLKIAIVLNTAWNIYNYRLGLIRILIAKGHQVFAIAPIDDYVSTIEETGCTFIPVYQLSRKGTNPIKDWQYSRELSRIYKTYGIDLALQYTIKPNIYGSIAARKAGIKSISTVTGLGYSFLSNGLVNKIAKKLYQYAFKSCSLIAFQNRDDRQLFTSLGLCPVEKTTLIKGSGINTSYFKPMERPDKAPFTFLFVGRLLYDKGVIELLEAAKILRTKKYPVNIWLVGAIDEGNPSAITPTILEEYTSNNTVTYLGSSSDVRSIMKDADVVVLPSYREGLPRVMLESLAMAKPIITTDVAGCREVIEPHDKNGFLIPVKDKNALADAMEKMYHLSVDQRATMGNIGRQMALDIFDEKAIIQRYLDEIRQL